MLMPGRYLSDTSARCQTITQTRFFTTYVDSCWTVPGWIHWNPWVIRIGSATVTPAGTAIQAVLPDPSSMVYISRTAVPSAINHVSLLVESVTNPVVISVVETVDGQEVVLGEQLLQAAQMSTVSFSITPSTPSIRIRVRWFTAPAIMRWRTICVQEPQMQSETYLVDVCDEMGDKYRFGYNGQEKVNEMSGIGNHNTAEFWEYDTRVARRWNIEPLIKKYTGNSSYLIFANNPIFFSDPDGKDIIVLGNTSGARGAGHGAILVGNYKNGWTYISKDGYDGSAFGSQSKYIDKRFNSIEEFRNSPHNFVTVETHSTVEGKQASTLTYKLDNDGNKIQRYDKAIYIGTTQSDGTSTDKKTITAATNIAKADYCLGKSDCSDVITSGLNESIDNNGNQIKNGELQQPWGGLNDEKPNAKFDKIKDRNKRALKYDIGVMPDNKKLKSGENGKKK